MKYTLTQMIKAISDEIESMSTQREQNHPDYDKPKHELFTSIHAALSSFQYNMVQASNIIFAHTKYKGAKYTLPLGEALSIMAGNLAILKEQKEAALSRCAALTERLDSLYQKDLFKANLPD